MYALAKNKPFYTILIILNMFLWYPLNDDETYRNIFFCCCVLLRTISLLSALGTLAHLFSVIKENKNIDISEDIGDLAGFVGCMVVCLNFLYHHSRWSHLFNSLLDFKEFGKPPKYDEVVKRGNIIPLVSIVYSALGMIWYCLVSYMQVPECKRTNSELNLNEPCGMINPTWMPFEKMETKYFYMCYIFQGIGVFVYIPSAFVICMIPWQAVDVLVTRIDHLKGLFKNAFNPKESNLCLKRLRYCIKYHQDIIKTAEELNKLVKLTIRSFFFTAAIVMGSLGSQVVKESTPKAITFVMGYVTATFFVCHGGQKLIDESLDLIKSIYDSRWYEMDPKIKKDLVFVIARCQKPMYLAAPASMGYIGYVLFTNMIKTSYSYLTLLNQVVQ